MKSPIWPILVLVGILALSGCASSGWPFSIGTGGDHHGNNTPALEWGHLLRVAGFVIIIITVVACIAAVENQKIATATGIGAVGAIGVIFCLCVGLAIPIIQQVLLISSIALVVAGFSWFGWKLWHGGFNLSSVKVALTQDLASAKALGKSLNPSTP